MGFKADADIKWNKEVIAARHQTIGQKFETEMPISTAYRSKTFLLSPRLAEKTLSKN